MKDEAVKMKTIVLVGHCGPDMFMLRTAIGRAVPEAALERVNDSDSLKAFLNADSVLLVNRVLDGPFATRSGIELIERIAGGQNPPTCLLISDLEDAQTQAIEAGARPGFGKRQLYEQSTAERLREAAGG